jgi:hypothetical protein
MADIRNVQPAQPPIAPTESDGVNYRGILWFVIILTVTVLVCQVLMVGVFKMFQHQVTTADPGRPAMMAPATSPEPGMAVDIGAPGPALLTDESGNLRQFRQAEDEDMHSYGWIDKNAGIVRIPIDKAKELLLERGIPGGKPMPTTGPAPTQGKPTEPTTKPTQKKGGL